MPIDYEAFKLQYNLHSPGVPHIKSEWEWHKIREALRFSLAPELSNLEEIGILILMRDFIESMDKAMDRVAEKWQPRLKEFTVNGETNE